MSAAEGLLLLDLDDTLVVRAPLFAAWGRDFLAEHDLAVDLDWLVEHDRGGTTPRRELHAELVEVGYPGSFEDFTDREDAVSAAYRVTDDGWAALHEARDAGWRIGVVTNGTVRRQTAKLAATGLADFVDAVCISEEVGVAKPDPVIFTTAAERAGTALDRAWMVGDNVDADIAGARNAGIRSVLVPPHGWIDFDSGAEPDHEAPDLAAAVRLALAG